MDDAGWMEDPVSRAVRAPGGFLLPSPSWSVGEIPYAASGERERAAAATATLD